MNCRRPSRSVQFISSSVALALFGLVASASARPTSVIVQPNAGGEGIQKALDHVRKGGEVVLRPGTYLIPKPIILRRSHLTLRGAGPTTILLLADNANCPVVILGDPISRTASPTADIHVSDLAIDGNRLRQKSEFWRKAADGGLINNNGINVWEAQGVTIDRVVCGHCRSGGMVTSAHTRRLTVSDFTSFDNQFDGLACYLTEDSHFNRLSLHDNKAAGISLDLDFNNNVIAGALLAGNDLGVFMRQSCSNTFDRLTIDKSRHHGVFMAQTGVDDPAGWHLCPGTECTWNSFDKLLITNCGGKAFVVNNASCKNNVIESGRFFDNAQGGLFQAPTNPVTVHSLIDRQRQPAANPAVPKPQPSEQDAPADPEDVGAL
jgi:hypothetical protein